MKTLYKRIAHMIMALVMLVSLTATVSASELHEFTAEDEPTEIYAILLETYGKDAADDYKWSLLANAGIIDDFNDIDNHEIGPKDDYKFADRLIAADEANWIIQKANKTGRYTPVGVDYAAPEAQVFDDVVPGTWYYEAINAMAAGGLLTGYTDGLFHPDDPITVAQYSTVFAKIYGIHSTEWDWNYATVYYYLPVYDTDGNITGLKHHGGPTDENGNPYNTENGPRSYRQSYHWAQEDQINIAFMARHHSALQHEVLDEPVIRGQMLAEMATLYVNKYGNDDIPKTWTLDDIPDRDIIEAGPATILGSNYQTNAGITTASNITETTWKQYAANNAWSYLDIIRTYNVGITTGVDDNHTCNPLGIVTRAQFCQMLYNMGITTENSVPLPKGGLM